MTENSRSGPKGRPPDTLITLSVGSVNTAYTRCDRYVLDPRRTGSDVSTYMPAKSARLAAVIAIVTYVEANRKNPFIA